MHDLPSMARTGLATALLAAAVAVPVGTTAAQTAAAGAGQDDANTQGNEVAATGTLASHPAEGASTPRFRRGTVLTVPPFAPLFATEEDALAFWDMLARTYDSPMPDPRTVAKAFIQERLGIDGDKYVVAHFATAERRQEGSADNGMLLTDALMKAFPEHSRHTFFGTFADVAQGLTTGGRQSPSAFAFVQGVVTCRNAGDCFSRIGRFLWSRTGPGYIYNAFIGPGNVVETAAEDLRPLDEAFGIYPTLSDFTPEHASPIRLSQVIGKFREEGVFSELPYIRRLNTAFDDYWSMARSEWPQIARYRFVQEARLARANGVLTEAQFELVMQGGAPRVPLDGPIALWQLSNSPPAASVTARRFDINGYAASDIVRFVAADGSGAMYIPGDESPFVVFGDETELQAWVVQQAEDRDTLDDLISHFSIYNRQDGTLWTGVAQGLANLASNRWRADRRTIDANDELIDGDVFEDMRVQVEARLRDDARMRTSTAWDAWRTTLNQTNAILGPLGYVPPIAIPVQAGSGLLGLATGIDQAIHGRTMEERKKGLEQAVMTVVTSATVAGVIGGMEASARRTAEPAPVTYVPATGTAASHAAPATASAGTSSASTEVMVAYSLGAIARSPSIAEGLEENIPQLRQFDQQGVDARTPFNMLAIEREAQRRGYLVQTLPRNVEEWTRRVIDLKKTEIDETRHRLDDFRADSLRTNLAGYQVSFDHSLVYRVDARKPAEVIQNGGFGASVEFNDIEPMLRQQSAIGSGSLRASNTVFTMWQEGYARLQLPVTFNQYAVWTEGRTVASASDNHDPLLYDYMLDEVHFPANVPAQNIFIVDSFDPFIARALASIYESQFVSTPYGVPLDAFREYFAGRLDIGSPNRFTSPRLIPNRLTPPPATSSETGATVDTRQWFLR